MTHNFSLIYQIRDFGSGQILQPRQIYLSPGFAKIAPWWLVRRDYFSAKVPGLVSADCATNVYSLNDRAVMAAQGIHILSMQIPFMQNILRIEPVTFNEWLYILVLAVPMVLGMELFKLFNSKKII